MVFLPMLRFFVITLHNGKQELFCNVRARADKDKNIRLQRRCGKRLSRVRCKRKCFCFGRCFFYFFTQVQFIILPLTCCNRLLLFTIPFSSARKRTSSFLEKQEDFQAEKVGHTDVFSGIYSKYLALT